jgi:hypothetical protein
MTPCRHLTLGLLLCSLMLNPVQALPAEPPASAARAATSDFDRGIRLLCSAAGRRAVQAEAAKWLGQAAQRGHAGAQSVLGWMHMAGIGVTRDETAAARWLQPSAAAGNTAAQNNLGLLYATGKGVAHSHARADAWFRTAADHGSAEAARNLHVLNHGDEGAPTVPGRPAATAPDPRLHAANCRI